MRNRDLITRLLPIVRAATANPNGHCCFTVGDFCYRWQTETEPGVSPQVQFWNGEDGGDAAFAWISGGDLHLVSRSTDDLLLEEMVGWAEGVGDPARLRIPVQERATALQRILSKRGYEPTEPTLVLHSLALDSPLQSPRVPGYRITHYSDSAQLEGWAAAYRLAFAPEVMTQVIRQRVNDDPLFRSDLDLVASDENGEIVAFALAWFDPETESGTFEPIGCVPAHRRRGLSQALMREGLRRLQRLGALHAYVITTERRLPANRLYESLGFQPQARSVVWRRQDGIKDDEK